MEEFKIRFLDHVAIRVADIEKSVKWYKEVLGLKRYQLKAWGDFPIFMLSGKTGVALFPANIEYSAHDTSLRSIGIDHFAFNVSNQDFVKAREKYEALGIKYHFSDHTYFHSIYTNDPDGHEVELTTIMVDEDSFYNS